MSVNKNCAFCGTRKGNVNTGHTFSDRRNPNSPLTVDYKHSLADEGKHINYEKCLMIKKKNSCDDKYGQS